MSISKKINTIKKSPIFALFVIGVFFSIASIAFGQPTPPTPPTILGGTNPSAKINGYAWMGTTDTTYGGGGWVNFNCDPGNCSSGAGNWGVTANLDDGSASFGQLSGNAWSNNLGWLTFNQQAVSGCWANNGSETFPGTARILRTPNSNNLFPIVGWGKFVGGDEISNDGWDGCVSFSGSSYGVFINPATGVLEGFAWGSSPVVGWVGFKNSLCPVFCNVIIELPDRPEDPEELASSVTLFLDPPTLIVSGLESEYTASTYFANLNWVKNNVHSCSGTFNRETPQPSSNITLNGWTQNFADNITSTIASIPGNLLISIPTSFRFTITCINQEGQTRSDSKILQFVQEAEPPQPDPVVTLKIIQPLTNDGSRGTRPGYKREQLPETGHPDVRIQWELENVILETCVADSGMDTGNGILQSNISWNSLTTTSTISPSDYLSINMSRSGPLGYPTRFTMTCQGIKDNTSATDFVYVSFENVACTISSVCVPSPSTGVPGYIEF